MAYLEEIPKYKTDLIYTLAENIKIVKYLGVEVDDPYELIGKNIFPTPYIPDTEIDVKSYICVDIYVPKVTDKIWKNVQIVVNVFSHKSHALHNDRVDLKSRVDLICIEVDKLLNGNNDFGVDEVGLISVMPYSPNINYFGKQMIYNVPNFNQRRCRHNEHQI